MVPVAVTLFCKVFSATFSSLKLISSSFFPPDIAHVATATITITTTAIQILLILNFFIFYNQINLIRNNKTFVWEGESKELREVITPYGRSGS